MLNPTPDYLPRRPRHLYAVTTAGAVTRRRRRPTWLDVVEWLLVPVTVALVAYAATGRGDVGLLVLACCLLTLLMVRPLVLRRMTRTR